MAALQMRGAIMARQVSGHAMARGVLAVLALFTLTYAAAPYVYLWRLYRALEQGDAVTLTQVVDWNSVRQGLKDDIAEGIIGLPPSTRTIASNTLPAFGTGFVTGIASNVVDEQITPQHLAQAMREAEPVEARPRVEAPGTGGGYGSLEHAFFTGPTTFLVRIRLPGQDQEDPPLRMELNLCGGGWKVIRAWIPQDLMDEAKFHT
jgi:Protein of unknown function (DUF2939)